MPDLWSELLACLDLQQSSTGPSATPPHATAHPSTQPGSRRQRGSMSIFEGPNQTLDHHRLLGGQILAQMIQAALSAYPGKTVKSLHAVFAHEGKSDAPVYYVVQRQHEGRSFAALTITARQPRDIVATAVVSMHAWEPGPERQVATTLPPVPGPQHRRRMYLVPWETRAITDIDSPAAQPTEYDLWMRTPEVDPAHGPALTAYVSDLNMIGTSLRPLEGFSHGGNGTDFTAATVTHSIWFHREFRTDDWLLLRQRSPVVAGSRCYGTGDVFRPDGTLVASFAQEGLLRFRSDALR